MKTDSRYIVGGAAFGAILGSFAGWIYARYGTKELKGSRGEVKIDGQQVMRLGGSIIGIIRQLLDLG